MTTRWNALFIAAAAILTSLIVGATPVRAQTQPFYNIDALVAKCMAETPKRAEEMAKSTRSTASNMRDLAEQVCTLLPILEKETHEELAKHWDSHDSSIRLQCIVTPQVVDSTGLQKCIEYTEKKSGYSPQQAEAARRAKEAEEQLKKMQKTQADLSRQQLTAECKQEKQSEWGKCELRCPSWMSSWRCSHFVSLRQKCEAEGLWNIYESWRPSRIDSTYDPCR
jgi:hypothetical protein